METGSKMEMETQERMNEEEGVTVLTLTTAISVQSVKVSSAFWTGNPSELHTFRRPENPGLLV